MSAAEIANLIATHRYAFANENELQEKIAVVLDRAGVQATREVRITPEDRLDFLIGSIAIEVKIHGTRPQVVSQLHRYAQSDRVSALILVSRKAKHLQMPATLNDKPVYVANLMGSSF